MAQNYVNNSIYSTTRLNARGPPPNYDDTIYSTGQPRAATAHSVHSVKTGASAYSHVTKKSSDFYNTNASSVERRQSLAQSICLFLFNPETGSILGRTWKSWLQFLAYNIVLYGIVAAVWAGSFALFDFAVLDEVTPTRTGMHSMLQHNPSLSFIPQPDHYTTLIRFRTSRMATVRKYVDDIVAVTQWYEDHGHQNLQSSDEKVENCDVAKKNPNPKTTVCRFNLDVGRRCNAYKNFGFVDGDPCIALKLNRVYGWVPDPYDNSTGVKVTCKGRSLSDGDSIKRICYHYNDNAGTVPDDYCKDDFGEFPHYYFPYLHQIRYMSPLVFVEFQGVARNVVVMVECEAWAKNIKIDRVYRIGLVQFELLID